MLTSCLLGSCLVSRRTEISDCVSLGPLDEGTIACPWMAEVDQDSVHVVGLGLAWSYKSKPNLECQVFCGLFPTKRCG